MPRAVPSAAQDFVSSVVVAIFSVALIPVSLVAVAACKGRSLWQARGDPSKNDKAPLFPPGCVIISGGRMSKGLTLARAFKRAGWKVVGVDEQGWGELCPMRFSAACDAFHLLPPAAASYERYSAGLLALAHAHAADLFIPVSGAGSSVEDARAAEHMFAATGGRCRTFIQDAETMRDLHDKDRFTALIARLGMPTPHGAKVESTDEAMRFLAAEGAEPRFVLKCLGLDENRGDMTLFPLAGDDEKLGKTRAALDGLKLRITPDCPYVLQEFIPGQEWCTHASVVNGHITSFVTCPSNDMVMTYEDATHDGVGRAAEAWTQRLLAALADDPTPTGRRRALTGHFSFDLIQSTRDGKLYAIECNARVHTAVIMLPLDRVAACYAAEAVEQPILRPLPSTLARSWLYNDLVVKLLPALMPSKQALALIHPSLPACADKPVKRPYEGAGVRRVDPTLIADDPAPFLVLWHVYWPYLLLTRWWQGKRWTRLNVSTGRIFEA
ncbi:hypothetical protein Q5752_005421 [Cryptotrichosporon argae]